MTTKEIQQHVFNNTGLKTSVRKGTGSMKGYLIITPIFQNGSYPSFPFEFIRELKTKLSEYDYDLHPVFCSISEICVFNIKDDRVRFKTENKPKSIENMQQREWGSKNSQIRLDKKAERYAKRAKKGNTVRYW